MIIAVICRLCKNIDFEVIFIEVIESLARTHQVQEHILANMYSLNSL